MTHDVDIAVYAPASIANLSVGFDVLGVALAPVDGTRLGDVVEIGRAPADDWTLETDGPFAGALPRDPEENVVLACCRAMQRRLADRGIPLAPRRVRLTKGLPIGSGLGSSAASVVAATEALHRAADAPLPDGETLRFMAEMEGSVSGGVHVDNVAPSLAGGLRLCGPEAMTQDELPWPDSWRVVVAWPGTTLVTREARAAVPEVLPRSTAIRQSARLARFVHLLHAGETRDAAACLIDEIAEPHRAPLLPGFEDVRRALRELGASAVGISGSGPSVFALAEDEAIASRCADRLRETYLKTPTGFVHVCTADGEGARPVPAGPDAR